jgi:hypothetical protein
MESRRRRNVFLLLTFAAALFAGRDAGALPPRKHDVLAPHIIAVSPAGAPLPGGTGATIFGEAFQDGTTYRLRIPADLPFDTIGCRRLPFTAILKMTNLAGCRDTWPLFIRPPQNTDVCQPHERPQPPE